MKTLTPAERLIVAADFRPEKDAVLLGLSKAGWALERVFRLADLLKGTGVYFKVGSILRACGYDLIESIHDRGLRVMADLKLFDIPETLATDGVFLKEVRPEIVTTVCAAGVSAMKALKAELPGTEVIGVTVLTSLSDADTQAMFVCSTEEAVRRFASFAHLAGLDGLVSSGKEVEALREKYGVLFTLNTPNIRPEWAIVRGDDQNPKRAMTITEAIGMGADRVVMGRPITQADDPYGAVMRTIDEIASATGQ